MGARHIDSNGGSSAASDGPGSASAPLDSVRLEGLLARVAGGEREALATVYDATAPRVFGLAIGILGDRSRAEMVTEETYLQVWQEAPRFDEERQGAISWILAIAHGRATDRARGALPGSRGRDSRPTASLRGGLRRRDGGAGRASPESGRVRRALERLTPAQRESLELAYLGGLTRSEVARLTRTSDEVATSVIRDGLIRLLDLFDGEE